MRNYQNLSKEIYLSQNQVLGSLVLNPPYKVDGFNTSPRVAKTLSFPFGIRVDSYLLFRSVFNLIFSMSLLMAVSSMLIMCFCLPIQNQNNYMFQSLQSLTNKKFIKVVKLQEVSTYNKLFSNAAILSLKDPEEVIHINNTKGTQIAMKPKTFDKYPSIQFAGF